jgi:hypothetical protein
MRNGTFSNPHIPNNTKAAEFVAFDAFPPPIRAAIRSAPFDVSAADMRANRAVMREIEVRTPEQAAEWLREQFLIAYRKRMSALQAQ